MRKPLISIITVVYNGANTIERTILSVLEQAYLAIEYIIVDGGSTDGTVDIIKKYEDRITKWISEPDRGIYDAMNKGIAMASGDIIGLLNADDFYDSGAVAIVSSYYREGMVVYHGDMRMQMYNGKSYVNPAPLNLDRIKRGMIVNHPSTFVNKEVYSSLGFFSINYRIVGDWDYMVKCYLNGVQFVPIKHVLAVFSLGGVSSGISPKLLAEMHDVRKTHNIYHFFDFYYYYDMFRFKLFGKNMFKLSLLRKWLINEK